MRPAVEESILECINKFQAVHNRVPTRVLLFRSGLYEAEPSLAEEHLSVREAVLAQTGSMLTYICLTK